MPGSIAEWGCQCCARHITFSKYVTRSSSSGSTTRHLPTLLTKFSWLSQRTRSFSQSQETVLRAPMSRSHPPVVSIHARLRRWTDLCCLAGCQKPASFWWFLAGRLCFGLYRWRCLYTQLSARCGGLKVACRDIVLKLQRLKDNLQQWLHCPFPCKYSIQNRQINWITTLRCLRIICDLRGSA